MKGITQSELKSKFENKAQGSFVSLNNELFYCIKNYNLMDNFFMTITSASDVWNTLWSKGGITAGRIDCDHAIFPYYTADKVADGKDFTGSCTVILVEKDEQKFVWEPFSENAEINYLIQRNLYKNTSGSKVIFEEINEDLGLTFKYAWTSGDKYGLIKQSQIINNTKNTIKLQILDGCRNILPAGSTADFQNVKSVLLDAYKKTDFDEKSGLTVFALSSVPTDKAEPSEGLSANVCWFSSEGKIYTDVNNIQKFILGESLIQNKVLKGGRPACLQLKDFSLSSMAEEEWYQIFDTNLSNSQVNNLKLKLQNKAEIVKDLLKDIEDNQKALEQLIFEADGIQNTNDVNAAVHHKANVLFNIMRGGIFADNGNIPPKDFIKFVQERNNAFVPVVEKLLSDKGDRAFSYEELLELISNTKNPQLMRLFLEYLPLIFSRRHGDPSRPWNRFSIKITDENKNRIYNYEGNWRDIFQNWEALCMSYPSYTKNIIAKFLNAMTIDGFNPYRISRDGVDWEILDPTDPWSNIGYWNDHQVIYLQKLLEFQYKLEPETIFKFLNEKLFSTSNIPYRIKNYSEILKNPRSTVLFDKELSNRLFDNTKMYGSDSKLVLNNNKTDDVELVSMFTKIIQIILAKLANYVPAGGIWMNTQRPEWNDANNALAGYGLSMVTLYYLYRMINFLKKTVSKSSDEKYLLPDETADFLKEMAKLYKNTNPVELADWTDKTACTKRKNFVDAEELLFQVQRESLYKNGHSKKETEFSKSEIEEILNVFLTHLENTIQKNKRSDGLYHAYNILHIEEKSMSVSDLTLMLEGQVAVLSSGSLTAEEALELTKLLKESPLFVEDRNTYILYPNKELPLFWEKNNFTFDKIQMLSAAKKMSDKGDRGIFTCEDKNPVSSSLCHFNADFKNVDFMEEAFKTVDMKNPGLLSSEDKDGFRKVYEEIFNHTSFTGRSGTFYAYEGLGSVYWHMVAKLMVAVQEYIPLADEKTGKGIIDAYYGIRSGIGFNKTPSEYGAFPTDPYSHTPEGQGAKQPGMTGQVKEEIITRWSELGMEIENGCLSFNPFYLQSKEFADGKLSFTRFGINFSYEKSEASKVVVKFVDREETFEGNKLNCNVSRQIFNRCKDIEKVIVFIK